MKELISSLLVLVIVLCLTGCVSKPEIQTVVSYQDKLVDIPTTLLQPCPTTQPPEKTIYVSSDPSKREQLMTNYSISLIKDVKNCNDQLKGIQDLQDKQRKIIEGTKK